VEISQKKAHTQKKLVTFITRKKYKFSPIVVVVSFIPDNTAPRKERKEKGKRKIEENFERKKTLEQ
jgi:hypothetical protein